MTTIKLSELQWGEIYTRIAREYSHKPSVLMLREVGRRELGYTVRRHRWWDFEIEEYREEIHLDFDDPAWATQFRLKYL